MFATRNIDADETILEEKPFVSAQFSWNSTYKYRTCEYCLRYVKIKNNYFPPILLLLIIVIAFCSPLETAVENVARLAGDKSASLPFPECCPTTKRGGQSQQTKCPHCSVAYCSEDCRIEAAQKYHFTICLKEATNNIDHPINSLIDAWK